MITETSDRDLLLSELKRIKNVSLKDEDDYQSRLMLSEIYAKLDDMEGVVKSCIEAINIRADIPNVHYNLGLAFHKLARFEEAKNAYIETLRLNPLHLYSLLNVGAIFKQQQDYSAAYTYYAQALKIRSAPTEALLDCGVCCIEMKQYTEAYAYFLKYLNHHVDNDTAYCKLGICMIHLGNSEQARIYFDKALDINPYNAESYFHKNSLANYEDTETSKRTSYDEKLNLTDNNNINESIKRAVNYFSEPPPIKLDYPYLYFYLQKKFGITYIFSADTISDLIAEYNKKRGAKNNFILFYRLINPIQNLPDELLKKVATLPIDGLTLQALYCDRWPSFNYHHFISQIKSDIRKGGYYLTHAMIALMWAKENNGITDEDLTALKQEAAIKCLNHLLTTNNYNDLTIETIAILQYAGYHSMIKHEWIIGIVSSQKKDGGWLMEQDSEKSNTHTSVLALWALLEYQNPGVNINWIEPYTAT